ncbi:hypothetical protein ACH4MM_03445 [Streptomyces pratensis]|uniref:hypothetical protein n=1 Tax=Streptomyces pratensis TaxID=1169025 RepID=UPI0037A04DFB
MAADIHDRHITVDSTGLFNATRHIGLLCHLTSRMTAEAEYQLTPNITGLPPAEILGTTAGHLGRAMAHYTQALTPLDAHAALQEHTLQHKLDSLDHHSRLLTHLDDAGRALTAARTSLEAPQPPAAPDAPAPVPSTPLAPAARRRI